MRPSQCVLIRVFEVSQDFPTYPLILSFHRSTDYGRTYEKLNDKVGLKTILSYLYVCPTNKRKVRPPSPLKIASMGQLL